MAVTIRNTLTNERKEIPVTIGTTVKDGVRESGFVLSDFSVRDKQGKLVDDASLSDYDGQIVNVGLPGDTVVGGGGGEVLTVVGLAGLGVKLIVDLVKLLIEERKSRRLRFKAGGIELELSGALDRRKMEQYVDRFVKLATDVNEPIQILPPEEEASEEADGETKPNNRIDTDAE